MQVNLYKGDCLEVLKQIPDRSVDLVVTDPPYEIATTGAGLYKQEDKQYVKELVGIELDEQYFNIAKERINKAKSTWLDNLLGGVE